MARSAKKEAEQPKTTAQALGSLIKSARDIMRKDKGLNGDLDRLPLLTWIMFLKFLDDLEQQREDETKLAGKKFRPAIEAPYRWRDWALIPRDALRVSRRGVHRDEGRAGDQVVGLEQAINRGFRHEVALGIGEAHGQFPWRELRLVEGQDDDLRGTSSGIRFHTRSGRGLRSSSASGPPV